MEALEGGNRRGKRFKMETLPKMMWAKGKGGRGSANKAGQLGHCLRCLCPLPASLDCTNS